MAVARRPAVDPDDAGELSRIRVRDQAVDRADERALATARRAGDEDDLARLDGERDVPDGGLGGAPVAEGESGDVDQRERLGGRVGRWRRDVGHPLRSARDGRGHRWRGRTARPRTLVDGDRQAVVVGVVVEPVARRRARSPKVVAHGSSTVLPVAAIVRRSAAARGQRAGDRLEVLRLPGDPGVAERVDEQHRRVEAAVARDGDRQHEIDQRGRGRRSGRPTRMARRSARCAAVGANRSRPWNVCETRGRNSAAFVELARLDDPAEHRRGGPQQPVVGTDQRCRRGPSEGRSADATVPTPGSTTARWTPTGR